MKKILLILSLLAVVVMAMAYPAFLGARYAFNRYFDQWGSRLVDLEKRGLLSREFGAAWKDILAGEAMTSQAQRLSAQEDTGSTVRRDSVAMVDGVRLGDYPSLSIIRRLNEINRYSNTIDIVDRNERLIARIRTDHTRARFSELPPTLVKALVAAEDGSFFTNRLGFEFDSYTRAAARALIESVTRFRTPTPRGTSTITQQVAKLFISDLDDQGRRVVSRSVDRKLREMRLAAALRKMYTPEEILEVYVNHCVTSDFGLIGYKDIAAGLFGRDLGELSDAQCVYLARMVKWGRNVRPRITRQCRIDMPRMAGALGWDRAKQRATLAAIDSLVFEKPRQIQTSHGALVDLANEFWLATLARNGADSAELKDMDLIDPSSLIRKKGNARIRLRIDLPLQKAVQSLVDARGYGRDTMLVTDVRIGSEGGEVHAPVPPADTVGALEALGQARDFAEPGSKFVTHLGPGDTIVKNIRYQKLGARKYRRSCFYYSRRLHLRNGQYFSYALMDAKTGELLAYYSRDQIGSRLAGLLTNRTPNGSSTAKPVLNALNFDLGTFPPYARWIDSVEVGENVPWKRTFDFKNGKVDGVLFANSAVRGKGYRVRNHGGVFEGCQYVFDLLSSSNNILGVETVYRLNRPLFSLLGVVEKDAMPLAQFFQRINAFGRVKNDLRIRYVTGVRVYKELARIVGVNIDSVTAYGRRMAVSDSMYSIALGTLEMTLYEQLHLYNVLYDNDLIERPASHPSLVIASIQLGDDTVALNDTVRRYHPFADINNIRPTHLGMHNRLISNPADGLAGFDVGGGDSAIDTSGGFSPDAFYHETPLANYAKSGTTDDVLRPFDAGPSSTRTTNYGLWNAVIRLDLARLAGDSAPEIRDVALACIGECNARTTGVRDGKTLHKFISQGLLKRAGAPCAGEGYFSRYEKYLRAVTPDSVRNCGGAAPVAEGPKEIRELGD